ncbi:MAG TPA: ABC transporter permease [Gemmatimonadaceae bacterium]|nr:ABC transporter permease [Gemmatimonadaceae bacterium]
MLFRLAMLARRLAARLGRSGRARELSEEMAFHVEMLTRDGMARGLSRDDARAAALRRFGNRTVLGERAHEMWSLGSLDGLLRDAKLAVRGFRRSPTFAVAVVLILGLGIGMSTTMFTVFKTILVDRLPITAQDRVVIMHPLDRSGRHLDVPATYLVEIARDSALFNAVAGVYHLGARAQPFVDRGTTVVLAVADATANYFDVLGMRPVLGRFLRPEDAEPGATRVLVLSYASWRRDFGGDPSVVGRSLLIPFLQQRARIVGVAPAGFEYPSGTDAWAALPRNYMPLQVDIVARLAPNVTIDAARAGLFALAQNVNPFAVVPSAPGQPSVSLEISGVAAQSFADTVLGSARPALDALTFAVGLLLLIACVNIGNLSLLRLLGRTREIAVRRAIGARSADVARLFAVENALLATLGGALGLLTAVAALRIVRAAPRQVPRLDALGSLGVPLAAAAGTTLFALLLCGVLPSLIASRIHPCAALRSDSRSGTESRSARGARQWLVAMQIALAVVMLAGAGLLVHTLARLESVDLGYQPDHLSILSWTAPQSVLSSDTQTFEVTQQLIRRFEATPGVVAATPIESEPFKGQSLFMTKLDPVEQPVTERAQNPFVPFEVVGPDYFRTFEIPILRGRGFTAADARGSERVVVINETLAKQLWPGQDALGKRLVQALGPTRDTAFTVVGIARDTRFRELKNVGPVVYFDCAQQPNMLWNGIIAVHTTRPLSAMLPALRIATHDVLPDLVLWKTETMDQLLEAPLAGPRLSALLLSGFSLVALLLSAIGLYGVMTSGVRRQTREIGVRMALGATPGHIRRLILAEVFGVVGIGLIAGLAGALGASRLLRSLLFQVNPTDPLTLAGVCVVLVVVTLVAAYLPARRAMRVDPAQVLRAE